MSKARNKLSDLAYEAVATGLVEALERGTTSWPLPNPPISDPDYVWDNDRAGGVNPCVLGAK